LANQVAPSFFLTDGNKLVIESWSRSNDVFQEWDCTTGLEIQSWRAPAPFDGAIAVSPDERCCVACSYEGEAVLKNLDDESQTITNLGMLEGAAACYSPDGKRVAIVSHLGLVGVWDSASWRQEATLGGFLNGASGVAFSPDGKRLAAASGGKEGMKLFDTESWQEVLTLEAQDYSSGQMAFSPDANAIGWLNDRGTLYIWRAPSWEQIAAAEASEKGEVQQP
jgi:WD40 repeat protein